MKDDECGGLAVGQPRWRRADHGALPQVPASGPSGKPEPQPQPDESPAQ